MTEVGLVRVLREIETRRHQPTHQDVDTLLRIAWLFAGMMDADNNANALSDTLERLEATGHAAGAEWVGRRLSATWHEADNVAFEAEHVYRTGIV